MDVLATPARDFTFTSFADITPLKVTAIEWADRGRIRVSFDGDLTVAQQVAVQQRILSVSTAEEAIRLRAAGYLTQAGLDSLDDAHVQLRLLTRLVLGVDSKTLPGSNPSQDRA